MSLQGIFNTSVQAMLSQSQAMSNISTNIANVNTTAYKMQDTHFATLLNHTSPVDKKFFTVNTIDYRRVDKQGSIATTNRTFDLAINGRGFFVTNASKDGAPPTSVAGSSGGFQFTRDGALFGKTNPVANSDLDGDGLNDREETYLTTADGSYVYGWLADENGEFREVNSLAALQPIVYRTGVSYTNTSEEAREANYNFPAMPPSMIPAKPTTLISLQANLSAEDNGRQTVGLPFVDAEGNSRTLTIGFNAQIGSGWTLDMASLNVNNQPVDIAIDTGNPTNTDISFDGSGRLIYDANDPESGFVQVELEGIDGPQTLRVDLRKLTQFADNKKLTVGNVDQDGYIAGSLNNTYFNSNGVLIGSYSNGEVRNLYKLAVATFASENKLEAKSGNNFVRSQEAGVMQLSGLGTPTGTTHIVTGALEQSNVDLADQFSKMIVTQRAYSSAAKVLTTADEMTMAARDLKR